METGTNRPDPFGGRTAQGGGTGEVKDKAKELTRTARDRALSTFDERKSDVSSLLERVADSIQDDRIGGYAADYARRAAELLRRQSADEMFGAFRRGVRERPGLVLSACFVAGLAFARLVKGSAGDEGRGDGGRFEERRFEGAGWSERAHGVGGYPERPWDAAAPERGEPWREGGP